MQRLYSLYLTVLLGLMFQLLGPLPTLGYDEEVVEKEVVRQLDENVELATAYVKNKTRHKQFKLIEELVGKDTDKNGVKDLKSVYYKFLFAFHIGYPAFPDEWKIAADYVYLDVFPKFKFLRTLRQYWEKLIEWQKQCKDFYQQRDEVHNEQFLLKYCLDNEDILGPLGPPIDVGDEHLINGTFLKDVEMGLLYALRIVAYEVMFQFDLEDKLGYQYQLDAFDPFEIRVNMTPFKRMAEEANQDSYDIKNRLEEFETMISNMTDQGRKIHFQKKLDEIYKELNEPPFDKIYQNDSQTANHMRGRCFARLYNWIVGNNGKYRDVYDFIYIDYVNWKDDTSSVDWNKFYAIVKKTKSMYKAYFRPVRNVTTNEWIWKWDFTKHRTCTHFIRESWEKLDQILEKLKCYMRQTYYFDLREKALQATQLDLKKARLFSNFSITLFRPCRITNDKDLVTEHCSRENHEICAPMFYDDRARQNPKFENTGGLSLLRPKAYYKMNEALECKRINAYIVPYKACHCGFILDCGKQFGRNLTCQLQADYLRRQCRGSSAYPCKSMPLAPGRHHESCISGFCNMDTDSCEDRDPSKLYKLANKGDIVKIGDWLLYIWIASMILQLGI